MALAGGFQPLGASPLVRLLASSAPIDRGDARQALAERMGSWLDVGDAITLFSQLNRMPAIGADSAPEACAGEHAALLEEFKRVREQLRAPILVDDAALPKGHRGGDGAGDFGPFHRHYLARQRDMLARIPPLRVSVRARLAGRSARLGQLAALDLFFEQALALRERNLLGGIPLLLASRFQQLQAAHPRPGSPAAAQGASEDWLPAFGYELQAVLLAEVDHRLEPTAALIAALGEEVNCLQ